jgi:electron transport complex protein RnfB
MNSIVLAVLVVTVIGLICAIVLAIVSKVMAVKVDEKFVQIRDCLPGANCGACGYAGCDGYAEALSSGVETKSNLCIPGGKSAVRKISDILGVSYEEAVGYAVIFHCRGDNDATEDKMEYYGLKSCAASKLFYGGMGKCTFGCLGFGDCAEVCSNNAICIENGIAHVDPRRCISCGKCAKVCPNHIIELLPDTVKVVVKCSNGEKGAVVRNECTRGCIACKKCERECPEQAIKVEGNIAKIDYSKCTGCGRCAEVCVMGCIMTVDFSKIHKYPVEA